MRPPLRPFLVFLLVALPIATAIGAGQAANGSDVLVKGIESSGDWLNITVSTYSRNLMIRSASIAIDGTLLSNEVGGVGLSSGRTGTLPFRMTSAVEEADLQLFYEWNDGGSTKTNNQTTRLNLRAFVNVRPVDATIADDGNVTIDLKNFGSGTAQGYLASLQDGSGNMVGVPYYNQVPSISGHSNGQVSFSLAQAVQDPVLVLDAGGVIRTHPLVFRTATGTSGGTSGVSLTTDLPSQSGTPGGTLRFPVSVKNTGAERTVALSTAGLPGNYVTNFALDGANIQTLRLDAGTTRSITLSVTLPASSGTTRTSVPFEVQVSAPGANGTRLASLPLEITPSGTASLSLTGRNWFTSVGPGNEQRLSISVRNEGSATAHDVQMSATAPSGWEVAFEPRRIDSIPPGEEATVELTMRAPGNVAGGRYVVDVGAESPMAVARERSLTVEVREPGPVVWPWLLAVAAAAGGVAWLLIRIKRR